MKPWMIIAGLGLLALLVVRKRSQTPVEISALQSSTGQGLSAAQEVSVFDRLFGIKDASRELQKWVGSAASRNINYDICHSDGTCEVWQGVGLNRERYPLKGPKYLLDYLGVSF